jgi:hypothetical protein
MMAVWRRGIRIQLAVGALLEWLEASVAEAGGWLGEWVIGYAWRVGGRVHGEERGCNHTHHRPFQIR